MKKTYVKPEMKFETVCLNESVADTCWGLTDGHVQQKTHYIDIPGPGYASFKVQNKSGNCGAPDAYNIIYYKNIGDKGDSLKGSEYDSYIEEKLSEKGGNNGQPYKGLSTDFPEDPRTTWS